MKKTLKKRLAVGHDTLRTLTEPPEIRRRYVIECAKTFPASSTAQNCPPTSTVQCDC